MAQAPVSITRASQATLPGWDIGNFYQHFPVVDYFELRVSGKNGQQIRIAGDGVKAWLNQLRAGQEMFLTCRISAKRVSLDYVDAEKEGEESAVVPVVWLKLEDVGIA